MNKILEGKRLSIKKMASKQRLNAIKTGGIPIIILAIILIVNSFYKFSSIDGMFPIIFFAALIVIVSTVQLIFPLNAQNKAILHLINSIESLENSVADQELINDAYEHLLKAINQLELLDRGNASYYSDTRKLERAFIQNIRTLVAPAMLTGELTHITLEEIAIVFTEPNPAGMEIVNTNIENQFEPGEIPEITSEGLLYSLQETLIGKFIISIFSGFGIVLIFTWVACQISNEFATQVRGNLLGLFGICITLTVGFMALMRKT